MSYHRQPLEPLSGERLRRKIATWWGNKLDTKEMAYLAQAPEWLIERELHVALDTRRAVVGSLHSRVHA